MELLQLNLQHNLSALKQEYLLDQRINIQHIWQSGSPERIADCLRQQTPFDNAFFVDGRYQSLLDAELMGLAAPQQKLLQQKIFENAARGIGFLYGSHIVGKTSQRQPTPALLHQVHTLLNTRQVFDFIQQVTGVNDIVYASVQASRYTPGNFLTRHNDVVEAEGRRIAYVFGFTPEWHPDWGGLLQFFHTDGRPKAAWTPSFNNLALFEVHHPHAVTYVTPFARQFRYSLTGWFRSKAPA